MNKNLIELVALLMIELETNDILLDLTQLDSLADKQVSIKEDVEAMTVRILIEEAKEEETGNVPEGSDSQIEQPN